MKNNSASYQTLLQKLDAFIRKYYFNKILKGGLLSMAALFGSFLFISITEYFFYFSSPIRLVLVSSFIIGNLLLLFIGVCKPLFHWYKLGKIISHEQAAVIIGKHFNSIEDKLLNVLQLNKQAAFESDNALLFAGIDQKSAAIKLLPFNQAINLSLNKKYLPFAIPPLLILLFILIASPNLITDSSMRLLHPNTFFKKQAPFNFIIKNKSLNCIQFSDYDLEVFVDGKIIPNEISVLFNGVSYPMIKTSKQVFHFKFNKIQKSLSFILNASGFSSDEYHLIVIPKPVIINFVSEFKYPDYLGKKSEVLNNIGDFTIPEGTRINWKFFTRNTDKFVFKMSDSISLAVNSNSNEFFVSKKINNNKNYTVFIAGQNNSGIDSMSYSITVIPDLYPSISVKEILDSAELKYIYFAGSVNDDYGLSKLTFHYSLMNNSSESDSGFSKQENVFIQEGKFSEFKQVLNISELGLLPGSELTYYFEVYDNDGVNGSKSTKSQMHILKIPSLQELNKKTDEQNENIKNELLKSLDESNTIQKQFDDLYQQMLQKKTPTWEDKKKLQDLINQQNELQKQLQTLKQQFQQNTNAQNQFQKPNQDILDKQKQLQELMDKVMSPEMKELLDKMNKMLDQLNKDQLLNQINEQKLNSDQLNTNMDRLLSLFKQLEFEQKYKNTVDQLYNLSEKQNELSNETQSKKLDNDSLLQKQTDLNKQFDAIEKSMKQLQQMQDSLQNKEQMPDTKTEMESIDNQMKTSGSELQKNNNSKSSQSQKSASDQMKSLGQKMEQSMSANQSEQDDLDIKAIRQILENLIKASLNQENLINQLESTNIYNPSYLDIIKNQYSLNDDVKMIEDSISELAKHVFQIQSFVSDKIKSINEKAEQSIDLLEKRQVNLAANSQQNIMMNLNDLALIFDDLLQQLQQQAAQKKSGDQMCQKPGNGKMSMSSLNQMQKQLNDQIQQLQKDGQGNKPGQSGKQGNSEQFAKLAQQQEELKKLLQQYNLNNNQDGSLGDLNSIAKQMQEAEKQLINKDLSAETLNRQQQIMQKLLDAENAEKNRDIDQKRESNSAENLNNTLPPELEDYLNRQKTEFELFKTQPPYLNLFYSNFVTEYYQNLSK